MSAVEMHETLSNKMRRPSIPFASVGATRARQTTKAEQGCPCCGAAMSAVRPFVDATTRKLIFKNESLSLDLSKFSVMEILTRRFPGVVARDAIIGHVWPIDEPGDPEKNIQVHITALRKTLAPMGLGIINVYDVGYRLVLK